MHRRLPGLGRVGEAGERHFGGQAVVCAEGLLAVAAVAEGGAGGGGGGERERVGEVAAGAGAGEVHFCGFVGWWCGKGVKKLGGGVAG